MENYFIPVIETTLFTTIPPSVAQVNLHENNPHMHKPHNFLFLRGTFVFLYALNQIHVCVNNVCIHRFD